MAHSIGFGDSGEALGMISLKDNPELTVGVLAIRIQVREIDFKRQYVMLGWKGP